jgi:ParB family chromosome partitioning protein
MKPLCAAGASNLPFNGRAPAVPANTFTLDNHTRRIPMTTAVQTQSEYRNLPLVSLTESATNPRRSFDQTALSEVAESIKTQGIIAPLVVRPVGQHFEIVAGARRYRAAQLAGLENAPVRIVELTDTQALETSIVENLQRRDVHPLDEADGFAALMRLEEPKYSVEQIAAKVGKAPAFIFARLKLVELVPAVVEAFSQDEIGLGHALLLAKLQPAQQEEALAACYQEQYTSGSKAKRILLPVRHLQQWIEHNILLELASAPFSKEDAALVSEAGACLDCPKRTGHNVLLFEGLTHADQCSDPKCYAAKVEAHVRQTIAAKPKLVQISTGYGVLKDGSATVPRNKYVEIRNDKPTNQKQRDWPEYKTCKFTTDAIVTEGNEKGELRRVCANPECPVHHAKKQRPNVAADAGLKAEQEKRRREEALAQATGLRVLGAIVEAVPVRLMKRDLLFMVERLAAMLDERRLAIVLRQHGIGKAKGPADTPAKLLAAFIRKSEESILGRLLVEIVILHSANSVNDSGKLLKEAADFYKVDVNALTAKVKQEFAAKDKTKTTKRGAPKAPTNAVKKSRAA